ncbi:unnamed protein product, partial [Iphiclides podalirius]
MVGGYGARQGEGTSLCGGRNRAQRTEQGCPGCRSSTRARTYGYKARGWDTSFGAWVLLFSLWAMCGGCGAGGAPEGGGGGGGGGDGVASPGARPAVGTAPTLTDLSREREPRANSRSNAGELDGTRDHLHRSTAPTYLTRSGNGLRCLCRTALITL